EVQDRSARGERATGAFGGLAQLALLTAMRRGELAQVQHKHVTDGDHIHLPKAITKTAADHDIPLTPLMRKVVDAQPRRSSALVFPSPVTNGRLKGWSKLLAALRAESGVEFGLHDLRRTCRTLMSRLGVSEDIAELAIGHQRADLVRRYNKD